MRSLLPSLAHECANSIPLQKDAQLRTRASDPSGGHFGQVAVVPVDRTTTGPANALVGQEPVPSAQASIQPFNHSARGVNPKQA